MPREPGTYGVSTGRYPDDEVAIHVAECAQQLGTAGGRTAAIAWARAKGWGPRHVKTVLDRAAKSLVEAQREPIEQTRARLLTFLETELKDASQSEDRTAVAAFTRLVVTLTGLDVRTVQHVQAKDRPLRELTTQQLIEEEERLAKEIAERATPVEGVVTETSDAVLNDDASEDDHAT